MSVTISNTITATYTLLDPATQNPAIVSATGVVAVDSTTAFANGIAGSAGFGWTVANLGAVASVGSYGVGIGLASGGLVTNGAGADIAGSAIGIQLQGATPGATATVVNYGTVRALSSYLFGNAVVADGVRGTVVNAGSILSDNAAGAAANGVQLGGGGVVVNSGLVRAASAGADQAGIIAFSGQTTVVNAGTIATGAAGATGGTGVNIASGGIANSGLIAGGRQAVAIGAGAIANSGTIAQTGAAGAQGIDLGGAGGPATLLNTGTVSADAISGNAVLVGVGGGSIVNGQAAGPLGVIAAYHTGIGFFPGPGAAPGVLTIVNYGRIASTQPGAAAGNAFAINGAVGSTTLLDNFGTVSSAQTSGGGAVLLGYGQIVNRPGALIRAAGGNAVSNGNAPLTVANFGTISGGGANSLGVVLAAGSTLTNGGTIIGEGGTAVTFAAGAGNRMVLDPGSRLVGGVYGGNGVLELAPGGGAVGALAGLNGSITGFAAVEIDPGAAWVVGIDNPFGFSATLSGLTPDDALDLPFVGFDPNGAASLLPGNVLQVSEHGVTYTIALDPAESFAGGSFVLSSDGGGGTLITMRPPPLPYFVTDPLMTNGRNALVVNHIAGGRLGFQPIGGIGPEWQFAGSGFLLGAGRAGFLLRNTDGLVAVGEVANGVAVFSVVGGLGGEWRFGGVADYLGHGRSQFLLHNRGDAAPGALVLGEIDGGAAAYTFVGGLGLEWEFGGSGDFMADGRAEFVIRSSSGAVAIGAVGGGGASFTMAGGLGREWKFEGTGDYLGHGRDALLLRNVTGGALLVAEVVNGTLTFTDIGAVGPEWQFVGSGDYAGAAADDFLMRNTGSGALVVGSLAGGAAGFTTLGAVGPEWNYHADSVVLRPHP